MPSLIKPEILPAPDLTPFIVKNGDQYSAGGSFGDVYRCWCNCDSGGKEVAVKAFRFKLPISEGDEGDRYTAKMARRELGIWRRLQHKNVVPFLGIAYGFGMHGNVSLVSLWMPNGTLHDFLANNPTLDVSRRLQFLLDIADGLHCLHTFRISPIVHGDLNSHNILLDEDHTARLADFGYASLVGNIPQALTYLQRTTIRPGSVRWAAPEQVSLGETFNRTTKSDIYSFGCVALQESLFDMRTGSVFIHPQVLSGKQPWSEVKEDIRVVFLLAQGHKPGRPDSPKICDRQWEFIQQCWASVQERVPAERIITCIQVLLRNHQSRSPNEVTYNVTTSPRPFLQPTTMIVSSNPSSLGEVRDRTSSFSTVRGVASNCCQTFIGGDEIVIAVMGLTGTGKSSFVNKAAGPMVAEIGSNLMSQTRAVQPIRCLHPDGRRNIVLLDTPGFDDTHLSDAQVLRIISNWLKETYRNNIKLAGILYLHRISDVIGAGAPLRNLGVFKDLCGDDNLKNVILVTTMWDAVEDQSVGFEREEVLLSDFWKDMICLGSRTSRFQGTRESAWEIIDRLDLEESYRKCTPLQIQREMVDRGLPLHETSAAKTLLRFFRHKSKKFWTKIRNAGRRTTGPRKPPAGLGMFSIFSRSPVTGPISLMSTSNITSSDSPRPCSPTWSTASACSAAGRQDSLLAMTIGLRLAYQVADSASIPTLRGTIGAVLHIAQLIEGMGGTHHVISQVVENSGFLLEEMAQRATQSELPENMNRTLRSFQRELKNLENVVMKFSGRAPISRFFLHDADIQAIAACTASIKTIYDKLEVKVAMDNRRAVARLEDQVRALSNSRELWQCECGPSAVREETRENGHQSAPTSHSL